MSQPQPLALKPALPSELLSYILTHQTYPTTLLICQSRTTFLSSLQRCVSNTIQQQRQSPPHNDRSSSIPLANHEGDTGVENERDIQEDERDEQIEIDKEEAETEKERQQTQRHHLLIPTLHQIVTSRAVNLVFVPTLSHLRAYLAVFSGESEGEGEKQKKQRQRHFEKMGKRIPLLVVYGLVAMHRDTSEWSAQGVASSVAALVEAGRRGGRGVVVLEEREWEGNDGDGEGRESKRMTGWDERVPMLNGSVKRIELESEDGGWSGRMVEVGRVLGRWFRFEKGEWDQVE